MEQTPPGAACLPVSAPGQNLWPKGKLSDRGFEAEQQFENVLLLDAYVYGSFAVGNTDLQLRVGNQVINWGESIFIQGVNQVNPIDVPAARRAGAELKEILLPVWAVYANWGFDFGSLEAFYQLQVEQHVGGRLRYVLHGDEHADLGQPGIVQQHHRRRRPFGESGCLARVAHRPAAGLAGLPAGSHRHLCPGHPGP